MFNLSSVRKDFSTLNYILNTGLMVIIHILLNNGSSEIVYFQSDINIHRLAVYLIGQTLLLLQKFGCLYAGTGGL